MTDGRSIAQVVHTTYLVVLGLLCLYGLHRYFLVYLYYRVTATPPTPPGRFDLLPVVTVQLPMYNERAVARRVIEAACAIDWPADKLEIQVLDDSTDESRDIVRAAVAAARAAGHDITLLHRDDRIGYKAGALEAGARVARGEFIAIFDADFLPPRQLLRNAIDHFTDERVAMVQCRWEHLNSDDSVLTKAQAILLDGHFMIEHTARNRSGRYMSFNGTAGIWRKAAIADAGGWQHDTLTEDLDLSYRAQLRGWRFVFLPEVTAPAELPPVMDAFKSQQRRWTKGGAQTCRKLLPTVLRSAPNWRIKLEACFHLSSFIVYILMVLLSLLVGPALLATLILEPDASPWIIVRDLILFLAATGSALSFYIVSQRQLGRGWFEILRALPALMSIGIGIAINNAIAGIEGLLQKAGEFVRTPKFGADGNASRRASHIATSGRAWTELLMAVYITVCLFALFLWDDWVERVSAAIPFLGLFIFGYGYVAMQSFRAAPRAMREAAETVEAAELTPVKH